MFLLWYGGSLSLGVLLRQCNASAVCEASLNAEQNISRNYKNTDWVNYPEPFEIISRNMNTNTMSRISCATPLGIGIIFKLTVAELIKKWHRCLWYTKVWYCFQNSPLLDHILSELNPIHNLTDCLSRIHVNIVLQFLSRFSRCSHSFMFSDKNVVCIFHVLLSLALNYISIYGTNNINFK
jgi:hypothetical protein